MIDAIEIRNYRLFRRAAVTELPPLAVFVGGNGSGKSTLFDVLAFVKDALAEDVASAVERRGGFGEVVSRGGSGPIRITIRFRDSQGRPASYLIEVAERDGRAVVAREVVRRQSASCSRASRLLDFALGEGSAVADGLAHVREGAREEREGIVLDDPSVLALKTIGHWRRFRALSELRQRITGWHVSDLRVAATQISGHAGHAEHLSATGDNLAQVARYLHHRHPDRFAKVLQALRQRVPGVSDVDVRTTDDGRLLLRFQEQPFRDPFLARFVSDGTLKMLAYLVLLYDPKPHPLLALEEPENHLYPEYLLELSEELRSYAWRGGQVLVSTHSPEFANGVHPDELFLLVKRGGLTSVLRGNQDELLRGMFDGGNKPGTLWRRGFFEGLDVQ